MQIKVLSTIKTITVAVKFLILYWSKLINCLIMQTVLILSSIVIYAMHQGNYPIIFIAFPIITYSELMKNLNLRITKDLLHLGLHWCDRIVDLVDPIYVKRIFQL